MTTAASRQLNVLDDSSPRQCSASWTSQHISELENTDRHCICEQIVCSVKVIFVVTESTVCEFVDVFVMRLIVGVAASPDTAVACGRCRVVRAPVNIDSLHLAVIPLLLIAPLLGVYDNANACYLHAFIMAMSSRLQ